MIQYIQQEVSRLKEKYDTKDPFELCHDLKIILLYESMGSFEGCCKGFIYVRSRKVSITINCDLPEHLHRIILAHEIGHAILHRSIVGVQGYHDFQLFDETSKMEYEANLFAAELLLNDTDVLEVLNDDTSFFGAARMLYVPAELLDFKWRVLKRSGYKIGDSPIIASSDFLKDAEKQTN